jgi:outer membrane protein assembly factor BamB
MKNNITILVFLILIVAATITGCTNDVGAASSWPGFSVGDGMAVLSYGSQIYAINTETGNRQWVYPSSTERNVISTLCEIKDGQGLVGDYNHTLYSVNSTNAFLLEIRGSQSTMSVSTRMNGMTYAPNADHLLYVVVSNGMLIGNSDRRSNWSKPVADDLYV